MKVKMTKLDQQLVDELQSIFGTHSEVARQLGITPRAYRKIRSDMMTTERTVMLMRYLLKYVDRKTIKPARPYVRPIPADRAFGNRS